MKALFSEFKPFSASEWKAQLLKDLKGEPYENLVWNNENGFKVEPFYTSESLKGEYEPAFTHSVWDICVHASGDIKSNSRLLQNLGRGATSISLSYTDGHCEDLLRNIQLDIIRATFFIS